MAEVQIETYKDRYDKIKRQEEEFIEFMLNDVVTMFRSAWYKPIIIGNMVYYYCKENGKLVPAYCYLRDYENGNKVFLPIYDVLGNRDYGWSNLEEVVRILDVIRDKFYKEFIKG